MGEAFGSLAPQRADGLRVLEAKILLTMSGGAGALLTGSVTTGVGAPTHTPTVGSQLYVSDAGGVYFWDGSAPWNVLIAP